MKTCMYSHNRNRLYNTILMCLTGFLLAAGTISNANANALYNTSYKQIPMQTKNKMKLAQNTEQKQNKARPQSQDYDALWKQVKKAEEQDLPQTVISLCDKIIEAAVRDGRKGDYFLALRTRFQQKGDISEDSLYTQIALLEDKVAHEQDKMDKMIYHLMLANIYADFAQQNMYTLNQRGQIAESAVKENQPQNALPNTQTDIREWGKNQFFNAILKHADAAFADIGLLGSTNTGDYIPLATQYPTSRYFHHDMLHVFMRQGCNLLENMLYSYQDNKLQLQARLRDILDKGIRYYGSKDNTDAVILLNLDKYDRFRFTDKNFSLPFLNALIKKYEDKSELCAEVCYYKVQLLQSKKHYNEALETCRLAISKYPDYERAGLLKNAMNQLLQVCISITAPDYAYPGKETQLTVAHKNADNFQLIVFEIPEGVNTDNKNLKEIRKICKLIDSTTITINSPSVAHFQKDTVTFIAPSVPGRYLLVAQKDGIKYNTSGAISKMAVGRMKCLTMHYEGNKLDVVVVDRITGAPVAGAEVNLWENQDKLSETKLSDNEGKAHFSMTGRRYTVNASLGQDKYMKHASIFSSGREYYSNDQEAAEDTYLKLFTDRAIYRPGQTVYVKGIAYRQKGDNVAAAHNSKYVLTLKDANYQEVASQEVTTDEFGAFSHSFILPDAALNGVFTIFANTAETFTGQDTRAFFRVEEYKRPSFEITSEDITDSYKLRDTVTVKGSAYTFSGVPLMGASGKYTVTRYKRSWWRRADKKILESGNFQTDGNGNFSLPVFLDDQDSGDIDNDDYSNYFDEEELENSGYYYIYDEQDPEPQGINSYYSYDVKIEITSPSGETQSSTVYLAAGTQPLHISFESDTKILKDNEVPVKISLMNLLHKQVDAQVNYTLYKLTEQKTAGTHNTQMVRGTVAARGTVDANKIQSMNWSSFASGLYEIEFSATDSQGRTATGSKQLSLFSLQDTKPVENSNLWVYQNGSTIYYGTSHKDAVVLINVFSQGEKIASQNVRLSNSIKTFDFPYKAEYQEGAAVNFCLVRNDQIYQEHATVEKPRPDKNLKIKWNVFRDKLQPGQQETWSMNILNPDSSAANAQLLAYMYDASLDALVPHKISNFLSFSRHIPYMTWEEAYTWNGRLYIEEILPSIKYNALQYDFLNIPDISYLMPSMHIMRFSATASKALGSANQLEASIVVEHETARALDATADGAPEEDTAASDNSKAKFEARENFNETAFFYPALLCDKEGNVTIQFTLPQSLTRWKLQALAHTKDMNVGIMEDEIVAQKEFMIQPNMPRFVRVGDKVNIASVLSNLSDKEVKAKVTMELFNPVDEKVYATMNKRVTVEAGKNASVDFDFEVPEGMEVVGVKIVADGGEFSDGERHVLAVLSDKVRLVESVAMPIRGGETEEFALGKLFNNHSKTATDKELVVEFTGNPAWYAVQALPTLAAPEGDNAVCWSNMLYVNRLASHIANSNPKIKNLLQVWKKQSEAQQNGSKGDATMLSELQKNQDLKNILLSESPWVLEARSEQEQKERIATLFELNNIENGLLSAVTKLEQLQGEDGGWSWYKGMESSRFISEYILTQFARIGILTGGNNTASAGNVQSSIMKRIGGMRKKGMEFMHRQAKEEYEWIMKHRKERGTGEKGISYAALRYLYLVAINQLGEGKASRSVPKEYSKYYNYFLGKVNEVPARWNMREKAMVAIVLKTAGREKEAKTVMQSIKEYLSHTRQMGTYFDFNDNPYGWNASKLNAQVAAIEAFDLVSGDSQTVDEMNIWLLKQKQTQSWASSPLTADAVYALLLRGTDMLENKGEVKITIGNKVLTTGNAAEDNGSAKEGTKEVHSVAGLNYIKHYFTDSSTVNATTAKVEKTDDGIAWGAVYARFSDKIANVAQNGDKNLSIRKEMFVKRVNSTNSTDNTNTGNTGSKNASNAVTTNSRDNDAPDATGKAKSASAGTKEDITYTAELEPVTEGMVLKVGDIVTARSVITLGRDMDFVQLKEQRGGCLEPLTQLSGYHWGAGTGYYEEIKDASTNFFFDHLRKGVYVLEVNYRVSRTGEYEVGLATIQCAYSPEAASHSASMRIKVAE